MLLNTVTGYAGLIAAAFAEKLLGRQVITQEMGLFKGGLCTVTAINPDPMAPEIVCHVRHNETGEELGIFNDEVLSVIEPNSAAAFADASAVVKLAREKLVEGQHLIDRYQEQVAALIEQADERVSRLEMMAPTYIGIDLGSGSSISVTSTIKTADIAYGGAA